MADNEHPETHVDEEQVSERETSLNPPTESLINETRTTSVRLAGAPAGPPSKTTVIAVVAALLVGLGLGLVIQKVRMGGALAEAGVTAESHAQELEGCVDRERHCLGELGGCVRDLQGLIGEDAPLGLAPRDFRVEKERKRRDAAEEELAAGREAILSWIGAAGGRTGKAMKDLKKLAADFRSLSAAYEKIDKEYKAALAETTPTRSGSPDPELRERNRRRSAYLKEIHAPQ